MIILLLIILAGFTFFTICVAWFYRNPSRSPPKIKNGIVSPADGKIAKIQKYKRGTVPDIIKDGRPISLNELEETGLTNSEYWLLAIVMSPFDVHMNRAPIDGQIIYSKRTLGELIRMRNPNFEFINERVTTVFENELLRLAVVQIAAPIASSIRTYVHIGDSIELGQKFGAILLGSQVDLLIPSQKQIDILTVLGSKVKAGETVIAKIVSGHEQSQGSRHPIIEGSLDVQLKGLKRLLHLFYLGNLWILSLFLKLIHKKVKYEISNI